MSKIIHLKEKVETVTDNLITSKPWEFRRPDWENKHFIQISRSGAVLFEKQHKNFYQKGVDRIRNLPEHFILNGGKAHTISSSIAVSESIPCNGFRFRLNDLLH